MSRSNGTGNPSRRREMDVMKLMKSSLKVYPSDSVSEFWVEFEGPKGTPYEDGTWVLHVNLPEDYPFKSPSIGFSNRILHPNVDEASGSVCLDVINQTWTPMYELKNIFEVFLPQLLRYPNPADPLNPSAAAYLQRDPIGYVTMLQEHVAQHATRERAIACIPTPYGPLHTAASTNNNVTPAAPTNGNGHTKDVVDAQRTEADSEEVEQASIEEEYEPEEIEL